MFANTIDASTARDESPRMRKLPFVRSLLAPPRSYAATCLDTSSPSAYRTSVTRMAGEAGRGNYSDTRSALLNALQELQNHYVDDYLQAGERSWGKIVQARAHFDSMMKGKTREQILDMAKTHVQAR